jgi:[phosphatase 2A protein]-leucine-carboxy methyltransferase
MFPPSQFTQGHRDVDAPIRLTDTDAALARLSAVQKGYLQDQFVKPMVPRAPLQPPRPPLINVGTFVRSTAIDDLVNGWLELAENAEQSCQIVSLGAGSDTRFWRIAVCSHDYVCKDPDKLLDRQVPTKTDW